MVAATHKVVMAAPSPQRRTLTHSFVSSQSCPFSSQPPFSPESFFTSVLAIENVTDIFFPSGAVCG